MTIHPYTNDEILNALQNSPVAGKGTYNNDLTPADADTTVTSSGELEDAISSGASNIYCEGTEQINISNIDLNLNNGQTIYSDRGIDGSDGALLYSTNHGGTGITANENNSRITGIRLEGPEWGIYDNPKCPGFLPYPDTEYSYTERYDEYYYFYDSCGILVNGEDVEIDNCEIYGWGDMGVNVSDDTWDHSPHIHHCYIHDCMKTSMGYAIEIYGGRPLIEYNYMNATRHAVAGFGTADSSFIIRNNLFGSVNSAHVVDQHAIGNNTDGNDDFHSKNWIMNAGREMIVKNNTFLTTQVLDDSRSEVNSQFNGTEHPSSYMDYSVFDRGLHTWDISIRGCPWPRDGEGIVIENNSFWHDGPQASNQGIRSFDYPYAYNQDLSGFGESVPDAYINDRNFTTNFIEGDNKYDNANKSYDPDYGAPVNFDGAVTADFVVNAITEGGEWKVDGIPDVDITLTKL